jgi:16S rRNA (cytidine1402-2'-O)-methyltransferase
MVEVSIERPAIYVVATPLGNLGDLSPRAAGLLRKSDLILAEDTRHSRRLLDHIGGSSAPLAAMHEHNERDIAAGLVARIAAERLAVCVITDAGTPLISDPGFPLVVQALEAGLPVRPVPGPCALVAALSVSGLDTTRFLFEGFLPAKAHAREERLTALAGMSHTVVCYEAPHRILGTLEDVVRIVGSERPIALARELTKLHETVYHGSAGEVLAAVRRDAHGTYGEFVLVIGPGPEQAPDETEARRVLTVLLARFSRRDAVDAAAEILRMRRNQLYALSLELAPEA